MSVPATPSGADPEPVTIAVDKAQRVSALLQVPDAFLREECRQLGIDLPAAGGYGVGMVFLSPDPQERKACEAELERIAAEEGQPVLGWRDVPVEPGTIGKAARQVAPYIRQVFVERTVSDADGFERKLYVIRRRLHRTVERPAPGDRRRRQRPRLDHRRHPPAR